MRTRTASSLLLLLAGLTANAGAQVSAREEKLAIPTWEIGPPAIHPLFPGPQGPIYPYTLNETLTDRKVDKTYDAVFLENEYVKVLVLPEIGGRVHGALDKTNGYKWLYWQPTIKPGLISMTGAWISGGIEWNFPHGHRPSGFMPVDHRIVRNADGSATVWVGETEPVYRMRWLVGITLFPGRSYFRCDYVFVNPTDLRHPFQFWATSATHANDWSQAQYPGDIVTGHGKKEFWHWPVDGGLDLSWWKNVANANSFFAYESRDDWFGTYDHRAQGGMVHVADHRVMPGKKLWTWGSGPSGRIWEDILTEGGGPYFEPQAGAFSDNQPDYHWMAPHQVRRAHDYWFPVRDIRGFKGASRDFAVNVEVKDGKAFAGIDATSVFEGMRVVLEDTRNARVLVDTVARIAPDRPFTADVPVGKDVTVHDLRLTVRDGAGAVAIALQPPRPGKVDLPAPFVEPGKPEGMTADELFHSGEWLDRFVRRGEALAYYEEALKRDPKDSRVNTEMGFIALKQTRWEDALLYLDAALERDPGNARIHFGKGLAFAGLGRYEDARDPFSRATYGSDQVAAAQLGLARLDLRRGEYRHALERLDEAASRNGAFADIPALRAAAHRRLGEHEKALQAAERALELDPMHFMGGYEKTLALRALGRPVQEWEATWRSYLRDAVQNHLELAATYIQAGLHADADAVLADVSSRPDPARLTPMVYYVRGYLRKVLGDETGAAELFARASKGSLVYTNPHRLEEMTALEEAVRVNPSDAHAHHLLGNVLYAFGRREEGLAQWEEALRLDHGLSLTWRNVGYAERQLHRDDRAAYEAYGKALSIDPKDARVSLEMDHVAEDLAIPARERLALLDSHRDTVDRRDDLVFRWVDLRLASGAQADLEAAYDVLRLRHFHVWEGGYAIHHAWVEVNQRLGDLALARKDYRTALVHYQRALEYPKNLEVAPRTPDLQAHVNWALAKAYLATGRKGEALPHLRRILAERYPRPGLGTYYQALAQKALGDTAAASALLASLEASARADTSAVGPYLVSLVLAEKGDEAGAAEARRAALDRDAHPDRLALTRAQVEYAEAHQ
jgi:tetratricopeptide (TPR) repeat protein